MKVAFYSLATGRCFQRAILDPGDKPRATRPGEGMLEIDDRTFDTWLAQWRGGGDQDPIQEYVTQKTGLSPFDEKGQPTDRYVVVQAGVVVDWVGGADPALGHLDELTQRNAPQAQLLKHPEAGPGWSYDANAKTFAAPADAVITKGANVVVG